MAASNTAVLTVNLTAVGDVPAFAPVTKDGAAAAAGGQAIGLAATAARNGGLFAVVTMGSGVALAGGDVAFGQTVQVGAASTVVPKTNGMGIGVAMNAATAGNQVEVMLISQDGVQVNTNPFTGGNDIQAGTSTLKLPAGVTDLADGVGSSVLPAVSGATAFRQGAGQTATLIGTGRTYGSQVPFEKPFYAIRLIFANYNTAAAQVYDSVKVAPSPSPMNVNNGTGLTWSQVTVNGSNTITVPAATQGAGGTPTNNIIAGFVVSDLIPVTSLARTDIVGALPLLFIRGYSAGDLRVAKIGSPDGDANAAPIFQANGYSYLGQQATGDAVTTITGITGASSSLSVAAGVIFYTGDGAFDCPVFGDSLCAGYSGSATGHQSGWIANVGPLLRAKSKIQGFANFALGGMGYANSILTMRAFVTAYKPKAVAFYNFSPNTFAGSQANLDAAFALVLENVKWLKDQGVTPIVITGTPLNAYNNPMLFNHAERTKAALAGTCKVLDFYSVIRDPANPYQILPAYNYDNIHITPAGDLALAQYVNNEVA